MKRLKQDTAVRTELSARDEPALRVDCGERWVIETKDNFHDLVDPDDPRLPLDHNLLASNQYLKANPVAGPVHVAGAESGDTLIVEILDIRVREWGWTGIMPGYGLLNGLKDWEDCQGPFATAIRHEPGPSGSLDDGMAVLNVGREVRWPLRPFIGTIATAPERGVENTLISQGPWGGNLDARDIAMGARVHMNVSHSGGLLYIGDVHASQADSELTGLANETSAHVEVSCHVRKNSVVPGVCRVETDDTLIQMDSARNAGSPEKAISNCFLYLMKWLHEAYGMSKREAYLQMSANSLVEIRIYQCTPRLFTCGVAFPRQCL